MKKVQRSVGLSLCNLDFLSTDPRFRQLKVTKIAGAGVQTVLSQGLSPPIAPPPRPAPPLPPRVLLQPCVTYFDCNLSVFFSTPEHF